MSPITHFLMGWAVARRAELSQRERMFVTVSAIAPDIDGLGLIAEWATRSSPKPLTWWSDYHHVFGHNLLFWLLLMGLGGWFSTRRWTTVWCICIAFHTHILGDLVGARGPDGYQWPIPYYWPFDRTTLWVWSWQWALNSWQNFVLTAGLILLVCRDTIKNGLSPLEMISTRLDRVFVETLRKRFRA